MELRHAKSRCPRCGRLAELKRRTRLWEGASAKDAQAAAARMRAGESQSVVATLQEDRPVPRHDDPIGAAAAQANAVTNQSQKAEAIALWLTRLMGDADHDAYIDAMTRAGLARQRAEKEMIRMLAMDIIFEPRAGHYRVLE